MSLPRLLDEKQVNLSTRLVRPVLFLPRYHIHYHAARKTKMLFAKRCSFSVVCLYCFSQNIILIFKSFFVANCTQVVGSCTLI